MGQDREDRTDSAGSVMKQPGWDHQLELGDDLRTERRLVWKEALVFLLVLGVAAVRVFLV